jgi:hypothetical protein
MTVTSGQGTVRIGAAGHDASDGRVWTVQAVRDLGVTTDVETAGAVLGIGRSKAYELAKAGEFPVRVVRIGRRYVVPVAAILQLLVIE